MNGRESADRTAKLDGFLSHYTKGLEQTVDRQRELESARVAIEGDIAQLQTQLDAKNAELADITRRQNFVTEATEQTDVHANLFYDANKDEIQDRATDLANQDLAKKAEAKGGDVSDPKYHITRGENVPETTAAPEA